MTDETQEQGAPEIEAIERELRDEGLLAATGGDPSDAADDQSVPTAQLLRPIIDLGCDVGAPGWRIGEAERSSLADAYANVVDKYFPEGDLWSKYGVELNAILITAAVIGPRARLPRGEAANDDTGGGADGGR